MGVPGRIGGDPGVDAARHLQRSGRVRAVEESGRVDRLSRLGQGVAAVPPGIKHTFWGGTVTATKASNFGNRATAILLAGTMLRSEEHTSELQSLMRISYAVFCLKKKKNINITLPYQKHDNMKKTRLKTNR